MKRSITRLLMAPSVIMLLVWMIIPLSMTIYFSTIRYNLLYPGQNNFVGLMNFEFFITDPGFFPAVSNTLILLLSVLIITVVLGVMLSALIDKPFFGQGIVRVLLISPFFIMPTVNALIWKNMMMNPVYGIFAWISQSLGLEPIDWLSSYPLMSVIIMVSWQWLPFAILVFVTALQSQDTEQKEAAQMDGATGWHIFRYLTIPHLARPIAVVVMIETIFLLAVFAEIFVSTGGGPGYDSTNLAYLIYNQALLQYDVGVASAGGLFAVLLANIVAFFLIRAVGKNLTV
ncbi:sugar ABC transporter permease [Marinomonas rhizomae]|uniref:Sorbitol ABC transporter membrane protein /mannitol ABC transporter membrane protein n=1 Tax=Marinomonas rhizomae TaxID=491948 RepID=A0A366J611_9GAMM|nr:sugar ABC transporter permease [Marinomonas rhizomae]RBP82466.1 sorbitol ABC transporter membrane protein /mannitol ABC transporter membrane protein [Marinomonas rhizomae]RNF73741.1 sugar ABC transporter permease [Marinomonas rhizomae]